MINIVKNNDKEKYVYSSYRTVFAGKGLWSLNNDTARNVIIFGINNSLSSHTDNFKNDFLILMKEILLVFMEALVHQKKILILISVKQKKSFVWVYISDNSYLFVNGKEIYNFKATYKSVNFLPQFCLGCISNKFDYTNSEEVSLKGNVYGFSVDNSSIDKSDLLNIRRYLITENNIK